MACCNNSGTAKLAISFGAGMLTVALLPVKISLIVAAAVIVIIPVTYFRR